VPGMAERVVLHRPWPPACQWSAPTAPREMISPGVDGLLVPSQDPAALGAAISQLTERGTEGRRELGLAGLARAGELSQSVVARRWEHLLQDLVARRQAPVTGP